MDVPATRERPADAGATSADPDGNPAHPTSAPAPSARETGPAPSSLAGDGLTGEEKACRSRLLSMGVAFDLAAPIDDPAGCVVAHPLSVSTLPGGVTLEPPATLTCAMAEATARFVIDHAAPAVRREFGAGLASVRQVSSYVCRPRNGSANLSEHAFANALDWGSLLLDDGVVIDIRAHGHREPRRTRLVETLRQAACGPFRTVLGPGSDPDHSDHFHFDMAQRNGGATFCQ